MDSETTFGNSTILLLHVNIVKQLIKKREKQNSWKTNIFKR